MTNYDAGYKLHAFLMIVAIALAGASVAYCFWRTGNVEIARNL